MVENGIDIFKIGSLAGLMSFAWLVVKDVRNAYRRPRLRANFDKNTDLRNYQFSDTGWERRVATLNVTNIRPTTAIRCVATLRFLEKPGSTNHLESSYALHWAGIDYSSQTPGAEPVDIGPESRRLDIVFTDRAQNIPGCWLGIPFALSGQLTRNQAYLPPGNYKVVINISCENGKQDKKTFNITSPSQWQKLDINPV